MATPAQLAEKARADRGSPASSSRAPPPLPPRANTVLGLPPYSSADLEKSKMVSSDWRSPDPRSSSTESLYPLGSGPSGGSRTLLLVYVHGFMGRETSFQSFPEHVHNLLSVALSDTHSVRTKIYPRYKSRKAIEFAREDFSSWYVICLCLYLWASTDQRPLVRLDPHSMYGADVVLLGHSMGGILAAEVALKPSNSPATGQPFHHRILGTVNFDTPFLGIHPGVISSGISSLFRPAQDPPSTKQSQASVVRPILAPGSDQESGSSINQALSIAEGESCSPTSGTPYVTSPLSSPSLNDPTFDPPYPNDVRLKERTGWSSFMHFLNKHSDNLTMATKQYVVSHLEFGACLADYPALKNRCDRLHALEDVDELAGYDRPGYRRPVRRIRFVNYYTASTGRPKAPKALPGQKPDNDGYDTAIEVEMKDMSMDHPRSASFASSPSIAMDGYMDGAMTSSEYLSSRPATSSSQAQIQSPREKSNIQDSSQESLEMRHIDACPVDDSFSPTLADITRGVEPVSDGLPPELNLASLEPPLPPIPDMPVEPEAVDLSLYTDKDARKIAEKEQKRLMKVYQQAMKDRESAIKDRKKLAEKREKKARQDLEKELKADEIKRLKEEKEEEKRKASLKLPPSPGPQPSVAASQANADSKPKKDKKFCMLPPKRGGKRDKCWVRVHMEGMDEVGAHCGLFFPGAQYEGLVRDVGARIESWVHEDALKRIALEGHGGD